jgi:hypothetical protein
MSRKRSPRTLAVLALLPVAAAFGAIGPTHLLPHKGGLYVLALTLLLGALLGPRAALLVFTAYLAGFVHAQLSCTGESCAETFIWWPLAWLWSVPVLAGALLAQLAQALARRRHATG